MEGDLYKRFRRSQSAARLRLKEERNLGVTQYESYPMDEEPDYDIFTTPPDRLTKPEMAYVDDIIAKERRV